MKKYFLTSMIGTGTRLDQFRPAISKTLADAKIDFMALYENSDKDRTMFVVEVDNHKTTFASSLVSKIENDGTYLGDTKEEAREALNLFMPEVAAKI